MQSMKTSMSAGASCPLDLHSQAAVQALGPRGLWWCMSPCGRHLQQPLTFRSTWVLPRMHLVFIGAKFFKKKKGCLDCPRKLYVELLFHYGWAIQMINCCFNDFSARASPLCLVCSLQSRVMFCHRHKRYMVVSKWISNSISSVSHTHIRRGTWWEVMT